MIDYETLEATTDGTWHDRLTALLIGLIAMLAAGLVLIQTIESQHEARANANTSRLTAELTARIIVSEELVNFQGSSFLSAVHVSLEGTVRALVSLTGGDVAGQAVGDAEVTAGERLLRIAMDMGAAPDETTPLDAYMASLLTTDAQRMMAMSDEQGVQYDLAQVASGRSSQAVLGLSVAALAGVLVGLSAVLGGGRAGRGLLLLAYVAGAIGVGCLLLATGLLTLPA